MSRDTCSCAYGPATSWRHEPHCMTYGAWCEDCATDTHTADACTNTFIKEAS